MKRLKFCSWILCLTFLIIQYYPNAISEASPLGGNFTFFAGDCSKISTDFALNINSDVDDDKITDTCEQTLAEKYAPIVYHSSDESNYPTNVDWLLQKTALYFNSVTKSELDRKIIDKPSQAALLGQKVEISNTPSITVDSDGTRSERKETSFYLEDVAEGFRRGSTNSQEWTTYFHAYPNDIQGITIQYWRFYAYNDAVNNHGGDWEGIHIVLDENLRPAQKSCHNPG